MRLLEEFVRVFQVPPAMQPYIHLVVDEREMELVVSMDGQAMIVDQVAALMDMSRQEAETFLTRAYRRAIVNRETEAGVTTHSAATFYQRLDSLAMYENWGDIPAEARDSVIEWQLQEFIDLWSPVVEEIKDDPDAYHKIPNRDVLLLEEALEMVEAAMEHAVVPCDCRAIVMACDRLSEVCIRLDEGVPGGSMAPLACATVVPVTATPSARRRRSGCRNSGPGATTSPPARWTSAATAGRVPSAASSAPFIATATR
jgi:hypothetical protein